MRVLVTGSRNWTNAAVIHEALEAIEPRQFTLIHGGAKGADKMADDVGRYFNIPVEVYPADWEKHGKAAGPIRNQKMLNTGVDLVLAFSKNNSRGTAHMITIARKAGVRVAVYTDDK